MTCAEVVALSSAGRGVDDRVTSQDVIFSALHNIVDSLAYALEISLDDSDDESLLRELIAGEFIRSLNRKCIIPDGEVESWLRYACRAQRGQSKRVFSDRLRTHPVSGRV